MGLVFYLTFGLIGYYLSLLFETGIDAFINMIRTGLEKIEINEIVVSLICDGALGGIGSVLSFIPTIVTLFLFLSLLEDTGYMARIAFIMDKPLRKLGLSGRSFVPLLIGFGCSVPAVMSARTMASERDRKLTIMLIPYMSCSAKLPVFSMLTLAFFGQKSALVMVVLYIIGIILAIGAAFITKIIIKGKPTPFMMELPTYRLPTFKTTLLLMWDKAKDFIKKAFTVIFVASLIIWFLQSFNVKLYPVTNNEESILALIGQFLTPIFKPLGISSWRITSAIITGLSAKESIVSVIEILIGDATALKAIMTSFQAFCLLLFILLYMPCVATFAAVRKELHSTPLAIGYMVLQTIVAYIVATSVYQIGSLFI